MPFASIFMNFSRIMIITMCTSCQTFIKCCKL